MRNSIQASENNQEYTIVNHAGFLEGAGQFMYKGYKISFSTLGYNGGACSTRVAIFDKNHDVVHETDTVQDAILHIEQIAPKMTHR